MRIRKVRHSSAGSAWLVWLLCAMAAMAGCRSVSDPVPGDQAPRLISVAEAADLRDVRRAGFDVDDTLLFSTPAFAVGFASGHPYDSEPFWRVVNASDREHSRVKEATRAIVRRYHERGIEIYAITARSPMGGEGLKAYLADVLDIPADHVYFEPDQKTDRIRTLGIDVFFGDSDSDIQDARSAGARPVRIQRSDQSSYRNPDGTLRKYQPGQFGEPVVAESEW